MSIEKQGNRFTMDSQHETIRNYKNQKHEQRRCAITCESWCKKSTLESHSTVHVKTCENTFIDFLQKIQKNMKKYQKMAVELLLS